VEEAGKGNVGAQRELQRMIERNDRMEIERALAQTPKAERIGKKEANALRAHDADQELADELDLEAGSSGGDVRH
jgi:putative ubiquitin-RnfH superfamily antitoxin RatB of RatAB toxin-antitoxin module